MIVRWRDGSASVARIESDVPPHHRDSPHTRHDDTHYDDSGEPAEGGESRRLEHLARFVRVVVSRLPAEDDLVVLGPGTVREDLERGIRTDDRLHHRSRKVQMAPSERITERQMIARARSFAGDPPPRRRGKAAHCPPVSRVAGRRREDFADDAAGWDGSDDPV
jgi:hypothetical protein